MPDSREYFTMKKRVLQRLQQELNAPATAPQDPDPCSSSPPTETLDLRVSRSESHPGRESSQDPSGNSSRHRARSRSPLRPQVETRTQPLRPQVETRIPPFYNPTLQTFPDRNYHHVSLISNYNPFYVSPSLAAASSHGSSQIPPEQVHACHNPWQMLPERSFTGTYSWAPDAARVPDVEPAGCNDDSSQPPQQDSSESTSPVIMSPSISPSTQTPPLVDRPSSISDQSEGSVDGSSSGANGISESGDLCPSSLQGGAQYHPVMFLTEKIMNAAMTGKPTRPFKAYPHDTLQLAKNIALMGTKEDKEAERRFIQFRADMIAKSKLATGQSNPKMKRGGASPPSSSDAEGPPKDDAYWQRRRKNNEAAKKSRDARRAKEEEIAIRAAFLESENFRLSERIKTLMSKVKQLDDRIMRTKL